MATGSEADFGWPNDRSGLSTIIDAARNGGAEAINRLLKVTHIYCRFWALQELSPDLKRTCGESDIRQECDIDVVRGIRSFRGRSSEFLRWLRQIVRTNAIDQQRRHRRGGGKNVLHDLDLRDIHALSDTDPLLLFEHKELVEKLMSKLSEDHRAVLHLRVWEGLKFGEVGRRMHRSEDAARQLFTRAIDAVRTEMGGETTPPGRGR